MRLMDRKPGFDARVFADAQALVDEGLERAFVLELYPEESPWLTPLLSTSAAVIGAASAEEPTWYFEASLKQRFIEAGVRRARTATVTPSPVPANGWGRVRAGLAGAGVAAGAAVTGVVAIGVLTAGDARPGDWNYAFKAGSERIDYRLSEGNGRVDVQLYQTGARVQEIIQLSNQGRLSSNDLDRLVDEAEALARLAQERPLDTQQRARLVDIGGTAVAVLQDVRVKQPDLEPAVDTTVKKVVDAVAAGLGGPVAVITVPSESPTASPAASPSATADQTPTPTPTSATATPEGTPTPSASATPGETPRPSETATPAAEETVVTPAAEGRSPTPQTTNTTTPGAPTPGDP